MSAVDGRVLLRYQGARARPSSTSAGSWPAVAYQVVASVWQASWNGTVRRTARGAVAGLAGAEFLWLCQAPWYGRGPECVTPSRSQVR